jgi:outer membrane protein TolC
MRQFYRSDQMEALANGYKKMYADLKARRSSLEEGVRTWEEVVAANADDQLAKENLRLAKDMLEGHDLRMGALETRLKQLGAEVDQ